MHVLCLHIPRLFVIMLGIALCSHLGSEVTAITRNTSRSPPGEDALIRFDLEEFPDDMDISKDSQDYPRHPRMRSAVRISTMKWDDGRVPYVLHSSFPQSFRDNILSAMREIESNTRNASSYCVRFREKIASDYDFITIIYGSSCHSPIGKQGGRFHLVYLSDYCKAKGVIMHELMHTLGFVHEQGRPDRDSYVDIHWDNVKSGNRNEFNKFIERFVDTLGLAYDFNSIMHYGPYQGAKNLARPAMTPKLGMISPSQGRVRLGQRSRMSQLDVQRVQLHYECQVDTTHITVPDPSTSFIDCDFENNSFCELIQDTDDDLDWQIRNGSTPTPGTGPYADHTTGIGSYAYVEANGHHGQVARLKSNQFPAGEYCLTGSLFFYGANGGSFHLVLDLGTGTSPRRQILGDRQNLNGWNNLLVRVNMPVPWSLVLEYHVGSGDSSDVAIDDVGLRTGPCE